MRVTLTPKTAAAKRRTFEKVSRVPGSRARTIPRWIANLIKDWMGRMSSDDGLESARPADDAGHRRGAAGVLKRQLGPREVQKLTQRWRHDATVARHRGVGADQLVPMPSGKGGRSRSRQIKAARCSQGARRRARRSSLRA